MLRIVAESSAEKDMERIEKKDSQGYRVIRDTLVEVEKAGWRAATTIELIRQLKPHVGEVRIRKPAYRAFFFWIDGEDGRTLHLTRVVKKSDLTQIIMQRYTKHAEKRRIACLSEGV